MTLYGTNAWGRSSDGKTHVPGSKGLGFESRPSHRIFLGRKFIPHVPLSTQVFKLVPVKEISQCAVADSTNVPWLRM